jgi:hypothetical protein
MIIYETIYKPWENNTEGRPWKYIGSDSANNPEYFGTVSSQKWKEFWKSELKNNPQNFEKNIIASCIKYTRNDLLELEYQIQKQYCVVEDDKYFNKSYATKGCHGQSFKGKTVSEESKIKMRESQIKYFETHSAWNKGIKSSEETRKKISESMKGHKRCVGRVMSEETRKKIGESNSKKTRTSDFKNQVSKTVSSLVWVSNGTQNKRIKPEYVNDYLNSGWIKGFIKFNIKAN